MYAGGQWKTIPMVKGRFPLLKSFLTQISVPLTGPLAPQTDPLPTYIADMYQASVVGVKNALVDYYVVAVDGKGNTKKTDILHVYVGSV